MSCYTIDTGHSLQEPRQDAESISMSVLRLQVNSHPPDFDQLVGTLESLFDDIPFPKARYPCIVGIIHLIAQYCGTSWIEEFLSPQHKRAQDSIQNKMAFQIESAESLSASDQG